MLLSYTAQRNHHHPRTGVFIIYTYHYDSKGKQYTYTNQLLVTILASRLIPFNLITAEPVPILIPAISIQSGPTKHQSQPQLQSQPRPRTLDLGPSCLVKFLECLAVQIEPVERVVAAVVLLLD